MTNKEAIDRLSIMQGRCENGYDAEAIYLAIKALGIRPCGEWIEGEIWEDTDGGWGRWQKCSVCRECEHHKKNFCPNCGADMSKEVEEK